MYMRQCTTQLNMSPMDRSLQIFNIKISGFRDLESLLCRIVYPYRALKSIILTKNNRKPILQVNH